jgi:uncharacterized membrane protein
MNKRIFYILFAITSSVLIGLLAFYFTQDRKFAMAYATFSYSVLVTFLFFYVLKNHNQ